MRAAVAGQLHEPVIGAGPDLAFGERRALDVEQIVGKFGAGNVKRNRAARRLLMGLDVSGEIRTDLRPVQAVLNRLKDDVGAEPYGVRVPRRDGDRSIPIETIALRVQREFLGTRREDGS